MKPKTLILILSVFCGLNSYCYGTDAWLENFDWKTSPLSSTSSCSFSFGFRISPSYYSNCSFIASIYFSTDATLDTSTDFKFTDYTISVPAYATSFSESITLSRVTPWTLPVSGNYYVFVKLRPGSGAPSDSNPSNDIVYDSSTIQVQGQQLAGSLQFKSLTYSVAENAGSIRIYVSRTGGSYGAASVGYTTANGTATAGSDYTAKSGTLTWSDGDTSDKYFDVSVTDDSTTENDEAFTASLSGASGASLGSPSQTTVTIPINDQPTGSLQFKSSTYTTAENSGSIRIYISRTGGSYGTASIGYATANGTATAGSDYTANSGTLTWTNGDTADKYFDISITDDSTTENDEAFIVNLSGASGASLGSPNQTTVTIPINDQPTGSLQFKSLTYSVAENGGSIRIYVSRTGGSYGTASINFASSNGTAMAGADYTAKSGTLNWTDGDTADKYFDVSITDDSTTENDEAFTVSLSGASGASIGSPSSTTVIIPLNDQPTGSLQFKSSTYTVTENGGSIRIYVSRTGGSYGEASVGYATANGTATAGSDYTTKSGTLTWTDGDTADKYFDISITDDSTTENDEAFIVNLSGASGASLSSPSNTTVTIPLNDQLAGSLQFKSLTYSVAENAGSIRIYVSRTGGSYGSASINFATVNGTAMAGADYTAKSGTLTWTDGDAADKYFDISITDDSTPENNEIFRADLSGASGASLGSPSSTVITIPLNDQLTGSLQFKSSTYSVAEDGGNIRIYVSRTGGSYGAASINYATANGTATAGSDYNANSGTLTWSDGDTGDKYFDISVINDSMAENDETFTVNLSGVSGSTLGGPSQTIVTISAQVVYTGTLTIQKCTAKAGKLQGLDSIEFVGLLNATETDLHDANNITVSVDANDMPKPLDSTFPINTVTLKNGKFAAKDVTSSLKLDTKTGKMQFLTKNVDLTGLACPITLTVQIGSYSSQVILDEAIVNGAKKPCPIQLLMGVKDTLTVDKYRIKIGKNAGTDSFIVQGTFTTAGNDNKSNPLVITLGTQTFTVPGGQFINKKDVESCKKAVSAEGPVVDAIFDFAKCIYTISVKNTSITQSGNVTFGINCFGVNLEGLATVNLN